MEMKLFTKNKIIVTLVVLLLLANTATLVGYWAPAFQGSPGINAASCSAIPISYRISWNG